MQGTFDLPPETAQQVKTAVKFIRLGCLEAASIPKSTLSHTQKTLYRSVMALDRTYASKVCGHSNKDLITQGWVSQNPNSTELDQTLFTTLVSEIVDRTSRDLFSAQLDADEDNQAISKMSVIGKRIKAVSMHVRYAWEEYDNYHVSPSFRAAEDCIIQDLTGRGLFKWLDLRVTMSAMDNKKSSKSRESLVFVLRRSTALCHGFARAVGAHLLTQQLITVNRGSMLEHKRSYNIFENAFNALCALIDQNDEAIRELVQQTPINVLTVDYYEAMVGEYYKLIDYKVDDGIGVPAALAGSEDEEDEEDDASGGPSAKRRKPRSIWSSV